MLSTADRHQSLPDQLPLPKKNKKEKEERASGTASHSRHKTQKYPCCPSFEEKIPKVIPYSHHNFIVQRRKKEIKVLRASAGPTNGRMDTWMAVHSHPTTPVQDNKDNASGTTTSFSDLQKSVEKICNSFIACMRHSN